MKAKFLFTMLLALTSTGTWADDVQTVLPWGFNQPWQMKFVQQSSGGYYEPEADANGLAWTQAGYDDSQWETLTGPMANGNYNGGPVVNPNYTWEGENHCFCLRRTFTLDSVNPDGYTFASYHDDGLRVYINGQMVFDNTQDTGGNIEAFHMNASYFHEGENQLALCFWAGPFELNYLDYALYSGYCYEGPDYFCIDGIQYRLNHDGNPATVVGIEEGLVTANIREKITIDGQDYPVTSIIWFALSNSTLKHVFIPKTITYFEIYYPVFSSDIETIVVDPENPIFDSRDNCNAVIHTETNKTICVQPCSIIPSSVKTIGSCSVKGNYSALRIPEGVEHIEGMALGYCDGTTIGTIYIPASCTQIDESPFGTSYFSNIIVDEDNPNYYMQNGCLIERPTKKLMTILPNIDSITIPEDVAMFGEQSFWNTRDVDFYYNQKYPWKSDHRQIGLFGYTGTLHVPEGTIPHYLYQEWDKFSEGFKRITDGTYTYYCLGEGDTWFAPHIDCVNYPASMAGSEVTLSVVLNADCPVVGFQFDVYLPEGMEVTYDEEDHENILLSTARTTEHEHTLTSQQLPDGGWRVVCYSDDDSPFEGNEGEVCTIRVMTDANMANGGYPIIFKSITTTYLNDDGSKAQNECDQLTTYVHFFTPTYNDDATSINETTIGRRQTDNNIYNLAGQHITRVQRGVNIIGGKKVVVK